MSDSKGPKGKDEEGRMDWPMPEVQEKFEEQGDHADFVGGEPEQDPMNLKAPESDHTPNATRAPRKDKPEYGKFYSGRFGL